MAGGPRLASLGEIERAVWQQLETAAASRDAHPWRMPVLATVDGDSADARTVILREVSAADRRLVVYTDARAGKVAQIAAHPHGTLVMWSPALGWQLRCRVRLAAETDGLGVTSRWARLQHTVAAQDYLAPQAPGVALAAGAHVAPPSDARAAPPSGAGNAPSSGAGTAASPRAFFATITADVLALDWLELHPDGHRRAVFDDRGARWVQP